MNSGIVHKGNNHPCTMTRFGSMRIFLNDDLIFVIKDVRHMPMLKKKMISLVILDNMGYSFKTGS